MKKYILLRDNHESGPYSAEDLSLMKLNPLDLIWIEGESASWQYPTEIEEFKNFVYEVKTNPSTREKKRIFISFPSNVAARYRSESKIDFSKKSAEPVSETNSTQSAGEIKEKFNEFSSKQKLWTKKNFPFGNVLNMAALFIGLAVTSVLIKKMIDGFGDPPLTTEQASVATTMTVPAAAKENNYHTNSLPETLSVTTVNEQKATNKAKPVDIKKLVKVKSNNDYKVGLFGGIDGLQLTVYNSSPHFIDKALVEIEYLKPNGDVIGSGQFQFNAIHAKSSKTRTVPKSSRGVKIRCRIVDIYSQEYKAELKQI